MAQITWRNVDAPLGDGTRALEGAARTFNRAFSTLQNVVDQPGEVSLQNYREAQRREGIDYQRDQDALTNARADARLELDRNQDQRAADRLASDLATAAQNRTQSKTNFENNQTLFKQGQAEYQRGETNRLQREAYEAAVQDIVNSTDDPTELVYKVRDYATKQGLDPREEQDLLSLVTQRDNALFGQTPLQQAVIEEQGQLDQLGLDEFDREQGIRLQTFAANNGLNEEILKLGRDPNTDISAARTALDKRLGENGSADLVRYFTEKRGKAPTQAEFDYIVGQSEENDAGYLGFIGGGGSEFKGFTEAGYEDVIDDYLKAIGITDSETREKVNAYNKLADEGNRTRLAIAQNQEDRLRSLITQQRANRRSQFEGIRANPVTSTNQNSETVNRLIKRLDNIATGTK